MSNFSKLMELNLKVSRHTGIYILKGTNLKVLKLPKNDSIIANEYNKLQKSQIREDNCPNGGVAV